MLSSRGSLHVALEPRAYLGGAGGIKEELGREENTALNMERAEHHAKRKYIV